MPLWLIITILAVLVILTLVFLLRLFTPDETNLAWDILNDIADGLWMVWCLLGFSGGWRLRFKLQTTIGQSAIAILLAGSFYIFLELGLVLAHKLSELSHNNDAGTPISFVRESLAVLPSFPAPPIWAEAALVFLAALVFRHHWREWKLRWREAAVPAEFAELISSSRQFIKKDTLTEPEKSLLFETVMARVMAMLMIGRKKAVFNFSIVVENPKDPEKLVVCVPYIYPPAAQNVDKRATLPKNKDSAAGVCYLNKVPIYIPSTRHLVGYNMVDYKFAGLAYNRENLVDKGRSLLCVPVLKSDQTVAVINVSSDKRNAFAPLDAGIVRAAATLLEDLFDLITPPNAEFIDNASS